MRKAEQEQPTREEENQNRLMLSKTREVNVYRRDQLFHMLLRGQINWALR